MLKMIEEKNSYFSEDEMIKRDPALFEEIVGQFLTSAEKIARRGFDYRSSTLVEILMESIDQQNEAKVVENSETLDDENSRHDESDENEEQWGNFDEDRKTHKRKRKTNFISKGEQEVLREEWIGIMYNNFISGKDQEFFDYSSVDQNEIYDESSEKDQDSEEKYFNEDDENSKLSVKSEAKNSNMQDSEEDELDVYMKHIEDHIKRQKESNFAEEFDD